MTKLNRHWCIKCGMKRVYYVPTLKYTSKPFQCVECNKRHTHEEAGLEKKTLIYRQTEKAKLLTKLLRNK